MYDTWWAAVPGKACISSETASAVSDRSELLTNVSAGRINCYDNAPGGNTQTTEQAWGGVGVTAGQGILTRPFMAGGWTWVSAGSGLLSLAGGIGWADVSMGGWVVDVEVGRRERGWVGECRVLNNHMNSRLFPAPT